MSHGRIIHILFRGKQFEEKIKKRKKAYLWLIYVFTKPLLSSRMRHNVNFEAEFN